MALKRQGSWCSVGRRAALSICALVAFLAQPSLLLAQDPVISTSRYQPGLRFRTLAAAGIDIYFHQGEEQLARRLARIIEDAAPSLDRRYGAPRGRVRVILVDQTDLSNGWATVIPFNLIEIAAVPPPGRSIIGNTDDWLRLVFIHEYTHVVHLEKSGGWFGGLRRLFGRVPAFYSNLFLPDWQIEGIATYEESALTGQGRVPAGDFRMILDRAVAGGRFASLDRATGAVIDWPGGNSAYLYGAYFHQYLSDRFGAESLTRLAERTAARLPFAGSRAYRDIYGIPLGDLWSQFEADTVRRSQPVETAARTRLTTHGFNSGPPAFAADGRLFYTMSTPHEFPALMEFGPGGVPRRVRSRFLGSRIAPAGHVLVFDQVEFIDQVALQSDLYAYDLVRRETRRLTEGARAADPDVSPDGRMIVFTVQQTGRRVLATLPLGAAEGFQPTIILAEEETEFSSPRWSPDGRLIAAERRRLDGPSEIVVIDVESNGVRSLVSRRKGRTILPAWTPDGTEVLFSADGDGAPFTLHAVHLRSGAVRQLRGAGAGAQSAAFSPDGQRLVFLGYSADGYDLYSLPRTDMSWDEVSPETEQTSMPAAGFPRAGGSDVSASRAYSPFDTLAPRFWIPYLERDGDETVVGAGTAGFDALARHAYAATAGWAISRRTADLQFDYSYNRWRPQLFAGLSDDTDSLRDGFIRTRELSAGVLFPTQRIRWGSSALLAASVSRDEFEAAAPETSRPERRRDAVRGGWSASNARRFGYSISHERGVSVGIVSELAGVDIRGSRETARSIVAEVRGYVPAVPRHGVLAGRLAVAASRGGERARREFGAGGSGPQGGAYDLGVDAIGLIRGFDDGDVFGVSAAVVNAEYRFPLGWPQRGLGTLPFFLRAVHGAVFFDAGHAWDARFRAADLRRSAGAEMSFDIVLAGWIPVTAAAGAAVRHDPAGTREGTAAFVRIGRAF